MRPNVFKKPERLPDVMMGKNGFIYPWGESGYHKDGWWVPPENEDKRDMRDPEAIGCVLLARRNGK